MRRALLPLLALCLAVVVVLGAVLPQHNGESSGATPTAATRSAVAAGASATPVNGGRSREITASPATTPVLGEPDDRSAGGIVPGGPGAGSGDAAGDTSGGASGDNDAIDTSGDLDAEDRARLTGLWQRHRDEPMAGPVTVRWALVRAGEPVVDDEEVAATAERILADPRGWSLDGALRFERVEEADAADFRLVVAAAEEVPGFAEDCVSERTGVPDASCTVGDDVIINDERWRDGALGDDIPLAQFRIHELNHEIGHWLGQGHFSCLGGTAAVNQQQFRSLAGCTANEWPLPFELAMVAARFGVWPAVGTFEPYDGVGHTDTDTDTDPATGAEPAPDAAIAVEDGSTAIGGLDR
ncbi:MAG: DUF3152 domain-containing protein [Acidimicrobiia bacterium]